MQIIYSDRSRAQAYLRCNRLRYLEYELPNSGGGKGITPKRKNIHLILGLAVHAGLETLLLNAMTNPDRNPRAVEDEAVQSALEELSQAMKYGVELDTIEQPDPAKTEATANKPVAAPYQSEESPIILEFPAEPAGTFTDFSAPIYSQTYSQPDPSSGKTLTAEEDQALHQDLSEQANLAAQAGVDDFLKKELAALVEAMTRAYARRRLKPLLEEFEILEVEREGSWKLGETEIESAPYKETTPAGFLRTVTDVEPTEIHWMSRHDALLLHRQTNLLYLLSFKTTGSWDRRKKQDAEIDMQGLSEAVDVENRLAEAWERGQQEVQVTDKGGHTVLSHQTVQAKERIDQLVSPRIAQWLLTQPSPPRVFAVRYEYLLKGTRREDKDTSPKRYTQDTPLIRAYRQDGMTLEDRRWATNYKWHDLSGQGHTLNYRNWKKSNVWEVISISAWIDLLDQGEIQPDTYDENGHPVDILADQFIPPVIVYRSEDDMRDWLEQVEAQEIRIAQNVAKVQSAKDDTARRSLLNQLFPQTRTACCWPGVCAFQKICYGSEDMRKDPEHNSDLYEVRKANHPIELVGSIT